MDEKVTNVEPMFDDHGFDEGYNIDSLEDIVMIEFWNIRDEDVCHFHFSDADIAFEFYNRYTRTRGFIAWKNRTRKSHAGVLKLKNFVCHREGFRSQNNNDIGNFKKKPTPETSHPLLDPRLTGLLRGHRFMSEADIGHMINMKKGGISVGQIYQALANQAALKYLQDRAINDLSLYFNHHVDADGTLRNLFWCDGLSRADYSLFGDVLAFDATYKRNKYMCPLVVFSGVNYHNQMISFAAALICDKEKNTYRWLLQQMKVAMNGKAPVSVITDGDLSMKFTIEKEFPNAHHRLCAWHLIRNATSNIGKPHFTSMFKKCMLGNYEIDIFRQKWFEMVEGFGVENKSWVLDMYKKRHSWATAHIRGKFFAGFRTTSRCEGLNSIIAKYVNSRYNLVEFIQHFNRCVDHIQWKEVQADHASVNGRPICVLVHEDIDELPRSLVLPWWTKTAKVGLQNAAGHKGF
ncbi:protein FAR1-RELATED SEQUENCE 5-like [Arachis hypogaea]|uniref:protein FAR1-RELATED SEQUENCE 5-like n=1 Tax=Arachis hypogaea TaxID=3818 RepID=UPI000DEC0DAA|nr:protein FAR1-RELATED SEQUENCE 5-like [Arachis hypogaea]